YFHSIDHGILAGFILFDRLIKNYNSAFEEEKDKNTHTKYENFEHKNLSWKREHQDHFAIIADSIIAHNIWFCNQLKEEKQRYKLYGLDPLIPQYLKKFKLKQKPLIFF
ncbi:hypothetical protein, partial [Stenotrophomonas maltophilia group sp. RNC7]|uniref:hypothetical protein n=1 Tax=Stenotrophomonas maltophilia group sp. RNC7 TaxID=3071467 RepID=UPI0027E1C813